MRSLFGPQTDWYKQKDQPVLIDRDLAEELEHQVQERERELNQQLLRLREERLERESKTTRA